jgi:hypothetical protein
VYTILDPLNALPNFPKSMQENHLLLNQIVPILVYSSQEAKLMERKLWISLIEIQHVINVLEQNPKDVDVKFFSAFILEQVLDRLMWVYHEIDGT